MTSIPFSHRLAIHRLRVYRAALGMLGDEQDARDAAQDALARAWNNRDAYDSSRPFYPWLCTIVRNTCRDVLRSRRPRADLDQHDVPSPYRNPADMLAAEDARRRLHQAMNILQDDHREILRLRHFEDLSYAELAEVLGIAEGTVMSRLYRARRALARTLMEDT